MAESVRQGTWRTALHNEPLLNQAFRTSENVYLIFSINNPKHLSKWTREKYGISTARAKPPVFGIARSDPILMSIRPFLKRLIYRMQSSIPDAEPQNLQEFHKSDLEEIPQYLKNLGEFFNITWIDHGRDYALVLAGKEVHRKKEWASILAVRDGTEVSSIVAEMLIREI